MVVTGIASFFTISILACILAGMMCDAEQWNSWPLNIILWTVIIIGVPALCIISVAALIVNFIVDWRSS